MGKNTRFTTCKKEGFTQKHGFPLGNESSINQLSNGQAATHYQRGLTSWLNGSDTPCNRAKTKRGHNDAPNLCRKLINKIDCVHFEMRAVEILLHNVKDLDYPEKDGDIFEKHFHEGFIRVLLNATVMNLTRTHELLWDKKGYTNLGVIAHNLNKHSVQGIGKIFEKHHYSDLKAYRDKYAAHFDNDDYTVVDHAVKAFIPSGNLLEFVESIQPYSGGPGLLEYLEAIKDSTSELLQRREI